MNTRPTSGYYREACNRLALCYDPLMRLLGRAVGGEHQVRRDMVEQAGLSPGERVLDVGCGTGTLAVLMAQKVGTSGEIVGIDLSPRMIERARRKALLPQLKFYQQSIEAINFPDGYFDAVTATYVLHEMPRAARCNTLREIRRVLKPGGRLLVVDIYRPGGKFRYAVFRLLMLLENPTAWDFLDHGLLNELGEAGFENFRQSFIVDDLVPATLAVNPLPVQKAGDGTDVQQHD